MRRAHPPFRAGGKGCGILPQAGASHTHFREGWRRRICIEAGVLPVFFEVFFQ